MNWLDAPLLQALTRQLHCDRCPLGGLERTALQLDTLQQEFEREREVGQLLLADDAREK